MKKIILLVTTALLSATLLVSCALIPTGKPAQKDPENLIYNGSAELQIVIADGMDSSAVSGLWQAIGDACGVYPQISYDTAEVAKHEIVFGETNREISDLAYKQLDRMQKDKEGDNGIIVYSNGSSLAVVYDDDEYGFTFSKALSLFMEKYVKTELTVAAGVSYSDSFDLIEMISESERLERVAMWETFAQKLGENGENIANAYKSFHEIYNIGLVRWMANLFDPDICVCKEYYGLPACTGEYELCGTAGFHYTSSARDTVGYLPVVEAMNSIMTITLYLNLTDNYVEYFPREIIDKMADFIYYLQDPDGYFYHPQWGKDITTGRLSRDLTRSVSLLGKFGRTTRYPTISDIPEIELASRTAMPGRLGSSHVSAVSAAVLAETETRVPAHLVDLESFVAYLESLDFETKSYSAGSEVNTQMSQIKAREKTTGQPFIKTLGDFLDAKQQENGLWHATSDYYGVNGLMKISGIYSSMKRAIPRIDKATKAAIDAIVSDEQPDGIVDVWNPWATLDRCIASVATYNSKEEAAAIRADMLDMMDEAITVSKAKLGIFMKSDGSFSYYPDKATAKMQGAPCSVPGINEGDMDGVALAVFMIDSINSVLAADSYAVPVFGTAESIEFMSIIKNASPVIKNEIDSTAGEATTFDFEDIGPLALGNVKVYKDTDCSIIADPRKDSEGNVLSVKTGIGVVEGVDLMCENANTPVASCYVFESEFCFTEPMPDGDNLRIMLGNGSETKSAHMLIFKQNERGVSLWEISSIKLKEAVQNDIGFFAEYGEWFKIRVEYYPGDHETTRIKIFVNDALYAVTDNYYDYTAKKMTEEVAPNSTFNMVRLYVPKNCNPTFCIDNVKVYKSKDVYKKESVPALSGINVDEAPSEEKVYSFDELSPSESYPDVLIGGNGAIVERNGGKLLSLDANSSITLVKNVVSSGANCVSVSFKIDASEVGVGAVATVSLVEKNDPQNKITAFILSAEEINGALCITARDAVKGAEISGLELPTDKAVTLRIDYYEGDMITLFYIDGSMCAMSAAANIGAQFLTFDKARIEAHQGLYLDDLSASYKYSSFEEETTPEVPSVTHGNNQTGFDALELSGSAKTVTEGGDLVLSLNTQTGPAEVTVPINKRSVATSVTFVSMALNFKSASVGRLYELFINDKNGDTVISFSLYSDGEYVYLRELTELGDHKANCAKIEIGKESVLKLEYFSIDGICNVYLDGKCTFATTLFYSEMNRFNSSETLVIRSSEKSSDLCIDDVRFESYNGTYLPADAPSIDESGELTFDYGGVNDIPSAIRGGDDLLSITETLKDGEADKALKLESVSGPAHDFAISAIESAEGANCFILNVDLRYAQSTNGVKYEINFRDGGDTASDAIGYRISIAFKNNTVYVQDNDNQSARYVAAGFNEWFNLRAEYYVTTIDGERAIRVKVFVNDKLAYTAEAPWTNSTTGELQFRENIDRIGFHANKTTEGASYYDNVSLVGVVKDYEK